MGVNMDGADGTRAALLDSNPNPGSDPLATHRDQGQHPVSDGLHAAHMSRLDVHDARHDGHDARLADHHARIVALESGGADDNGQ